MKLLVPPPLVLLLAGGLMWAVARFLPEAGFEIAYQSRLAFLFLAVALAVDFSAIGLFRRNDTTISPLAPEKASVLVTEGVYRYSRNPMYLGMVLMLAGLGIWLGNLASFFVIPLFVAYMTVFQILPEEERLQDLFGSAFAEYCKKTRRWI